MGERRPSKYQFEGKRDGEQIFDVRPCSKRHMARPVQIGSTLTYIYDLTSIAKGQGMTTPAAVSTNTRVGSVPSRINIPIFGWALLSMEATHTHTHTLKFPIRIVITKFQILFLFRVSISQWNCPRVCTKFKFVKHKWSLLAIAGQNLFIPAAIISKSLF